MAPRGPSDPELERHGRAPTPPPGGCERKEKKKSQHVVVVDVVVVRPRPQRESGGWSFVRSFRSARPGPSDGSIGLEIVRLPRPPPPPDLTFRALLHAVLTSFAMLAALAFSLFFPPSPASPAHSAGLSPGRDFSGLFLPEMKPSPHLGRGRGDPPGFLVYSNWPRQSLGRTDGPTTNTAPRRPPGVTDLALYHPTWGCLLEDTHGRTDVKERWRVRRRRCFVTHWIG